MKPRERKKGSRWDQAAARPVQVVTVIVIASPTSKKATLTPCFIMLKFSLSVPQRSGAFGTKGSVSLDFDAGPQ